MKSIKLICALSVTALLHSCSGKVDCNELKTIFTADAIKTIVNEKTVSGSSNEALLKGKVLILSQNKNEYSTTDTVLSYMSFECDETLNPVYANSPNEIETLVLLYNTSQESGYYKNETNPSDSVLAYKSFCDMTLIDYKTKTIIFKKMFTESADDKSTSFIGPMTKLKAQESAFEFLKGLVK
ncbi:MAG: hypothetical protein ABIP79_08235 [Chitinophagaceae bacterium]